MSIFFESNVLVTFYCFELCHKNRSQRLQSQPVISFFVLFHFRKGEKQAIKNSASISNVFFSLHNGRRPLHNDRRPLHNGRGPVHNGRGPVHNGRGLVHNDIGPLHNGCISFIILGISVAFINHTISTESKFVFIKNTLIILLFSAIFFKAVKKTNKFLLIGENNAYNNKINGSTFRKCWISNFKIG